MFDTPISNKKVRNGVYAYKYLNGVINIEGEKFFFHSFTSAIKAWRQNNPIKR